jgi:uncharacterized membrane protein YeaQ/YmgE (transglycosylase-associated protein family)
MLWTLITGLIVGAIAKFLTPGREPSGFLITICIGIGGSILATFLLRAVGWYKEGQSAHFLASLFGAILLLAIYHMVVKKTA